MKIKQWIVEVDQQHQRLDKVIAGYEDGFTRSRVHNLLESDSVFVNGETKKANYKVKVGDKIEVEYVDDAEIEAIPEQMDLDVVYEDSDVIVINKPRGIVVHPSVGNLHGTLVNGLLYHCKDLSGINGVLRPGIVHRIDKDTTGLLIVAKNDLAHVSLSKQLQEKSVSRKYYALVHGVIEHEHGTIDAPIGRDPKDRQKMCVTAQNSKTAVTHFTVIERYKEHTLIECRLETGRTHQIRVHMKYIKHPIVGDLKYSYRKTMQVGGQLLHAHELTFVHPRTNEVVTVNAPRPDYFEEVLNVLRRGD